MLIQALRLGYLCLGWVCLGFVLGAIVHIRLFWPFKALLFDDFSLLRPIGWTVGLGQGYCTWKSVFSLFYWDLLVNPLCSVWTIHYWTLWPFQELCLNLDRLIGPTLVHGSSHEKGHPKLAWAGFWHRQVLSWHEQDISWHGQVLSWHEQDVIQHKRIHKSSSPVSRSLCQAILGSAM